MAVETARDDQCRRGLETGALLVVLAALTISLSTSFRFYWFTDPSTWYHYGRHFAASFPTRRLAYGFPLLVAAATELVGPDWAYFVNVPVLALLTVLVYLLARAHAPAALRQETTWAALGAFLAVALLMHWNRALLRALANPYRDPLAHVLVLACCLLLVRSYQRPGGAWAPLLLSGVCLALATSTRETSLVMLAPLLLFGLASGRRPHQLPMLRSAPWFGIGFGIAIVPLLVQNSLVSGNPLVPAQALQSYANKGSLTPGVSLAFLPHTLPGILAMLRDHWGLTGAGLLSAGVIAGLVHRQLVVLFLSLPALLVYLIFYGSYVKPVARYLFVLDLFAAPVAGFGAAALLRAMTARWPPRFRFAAARALLVLGFAVAVATAFAQPAEDRRFGMDDVRRLKAALGAVPAGALVLAEHPEILAVRTFGDPDLDTWAAATQRSALRSPSHRADLIDAVEEAGAAFFVAIEGKRFPGPARRLLASAFDLQLVHREAAPSGEASIRVERIVPWSQRRTETVLRVARPGRYRLVVDVGALSRYPRSFVRLALGDRVLEPPPGDYVNHYVVSIEDAPARLSLRLESDGPVPSPLRAWHEPADREAPGG